MNRTFYVALAISGAFGVAIAGGCTSTTTTTPTTVDLAYEDAYLYDAYYPADLAYSSFYWTSAWGYPTLYFDITYPDGDAGVGDASGADGGVAPTSPRGAVGLAIRALARGEAVCPGHVTVNEKSVSPPCSSPGVSSVRAGASIVFDQCPIAGGGMLSGTVDVAATQTASEETCSGTTTITLGFTSTITNLSYTGVDGAKLVIPTQRDSGTNEFTFGQTPATITIASNGQLQIFDANGGLISDHTVTGSRVYSFGGSRTSYTVDGVVDIADNFSPGTTATLTAVSLTRTPDCCRPTGGTLTVSRTSGVAPGAHKWTFSSTCGSANIDGIDYTLPTCH